MAYRVTNGAGTNFNTAANWDEGVNTPSIHASTNITVSAGGVFSATFTAPNTTNACTGVIVPIAARGTAGNIIATLQENTGSFADVAGATATIAITSLVASTHVFFKFTTPYVFTATTAGRYRIKLNTSGASGTTSIAADSGGANFSYIATMNNNVVPTTGDDVYFISPNQGASLVMSLDTSPSFGSGVNTAVPLFRSYQNAMVFANNGCLSWPTGTSRTATVKGNVFLESGGELRMGSTSAKISAGVLARLTFDQNGTSVNYGIGHSNGGKISLQGYDLTYKKTTLSSGVGTAASPLITVDSVDWTVDDELIFVPTSNSATNYNETETRFIKTKNSATSYVLCSTKGGAESALVNSHTSGLIVNVTRGVLINTTNTAQAWYADFNESTDINNVNLDGCRLETFGSATASKTTIVFSNLATELAAIDDVVFYRNLGSPVNIGNNNDTRTYTYLIFYNSAGAALSPGSLRNKTFSYCYFIQAVGAGATLSATANSTWNYCGFYATSTNAATGNGGVLATNSPKAVFNYCEFHANRSYGMNFSTAVDMTFNTCQFGNKGTNGGADIFLTSDGYNTGVFDNCLFGSSTVLSNYTSSADGSEIAFHKYNKTTNDHRWYTPYGHARSTGTGLADTNVRTASSLAVRIAPESSSHGFYWDFLVIAKASSYSNVLGFIQKNATFGTDSVIVEFYLPGLVPGVDTATATQTMGNDTNWNVFNLAGSYTGTVPLYSIVRIKAISATAGAYCYIDDIFNGTNVITALDTWYKGKPSPIMYEQLGDASAVWSVATSTLTTSGTTGKKLADSLELGDYIGLK